MALEYIVDGKKYLFSYQKLRENYHEFIQLTDDEFINRLPEILHFACFVCYIKELGPECCLSDEGILHQLIHLLHFKSWQSDFSRIQPIRDLFKLVLELN